MADDLQAQIDQQYSTNQGGFNAQDAASQFLNIFGRLPTQAEMAQVLPGFQVTPQGTNNGPGMQMIGQMYQAQNNGPLQIQQQQQKQAMDSYNQNTNQWDAQTSSIFQQMLGRAPTQAELQNFGPLLASGQINQYGLQSLVGQSQEYQNLQTQNNVSQLQTQMMGTNAQYFNQFIQPSVMAQMTAQGQAPGSSGIAGALAQAAQQQNFNLQDILSQYAAGQYGQNAQNQQQVYANYANNLQGLNNANISNQLGNQQNMNSYTQGLNNFYLQQQAYQNYLSQYGNRNSGLGSAIGGLVGGGLGAAAGAFGGPAGAAMGYQLGSGLGSGIGSIASGGGQSQNGYGMGGGGYNYSGLPSSWGSGGGSGQYGAYGQSGGPLSLTQY